MPPEYQEREFKGKTRKIEGKNYHYYHSFQYQERAQFVGEQLKKNGKTQNYRVEEGRLPISKKRSIITVPKVFRLWTFPKVMW